MKSVNPATGEIVEEYEQMENTEIAGIIHKASAAQKEWAVLSFEERAGRLKKAGGILNDRSSEYAELMALEMGKPLPQGVSEAEKCAWVCEYYAENARQFLSKESIQTDASSSYITFNPLGTVLAIMPWNFPFWQLFRFGAPALMAGNAVILKHASNVTGCALAIESLLHEAGIPEALFRTVIADNDQTQQIIKNEDIHAVTLTGSTRAGKAVAKQAGSVLKKTVLELGGSDPYIVLEDADLERTAETCVTSRLLNSGQSCIAAKRFIVTEPVYEEFTERVLEKMKQKTVGSPFDAGTDVGPLARLDLRDELHRQVTESIENGAEVLMGGALPKSEGAYYPVTVLANVHRGMPAYEEELFGPVASVIRVMNEEEAIQVANDTDFGLGAAIFSSDVEKAESIAATQLEAGCCFVNDFVKSDPRLPFGGIKQSGYGRELSHVGIREFVNIKTVYIA
ncbi:NAD-dependent succinate-semialdehyde dehydrogenase [Halalkalibaculum sp. DA3122]|uniref:NAD-dependent succinate-semialdehyde dehydrogenase n=1 Tax=Halalkalibaculum sp. DA3122 TaxID=3373607 RepID=UPI00375539FE